MAEGHNDELTEIELPIVLQFYNSFVRDNQTRASRVKYAATLEQFPANGTMLTYLLPEMIAMIFSYLLEHSY